MKKQAVKKEEKIPQPVIWLFALISMVFVPMFYYEPAVDVSLVPKFAVLSGLLALMLMIFMFRKKWQMEFAAGLRGWPVALWGGLVLMTIVSLVVAVNPAEGAFDLLKVFGMLVFLMVFIVISRQKGALWPLAFSALILSFLYSCVGLWQYYENVFRSVDLGSLYKVNGMMSHKNVFSITLFFTMPWLVYLIFTLKSSGRIFTAVVLFLNLYVQFLIQTRSVWLAIVAFVLVMALGTWIVTERFKKGSRQLYRLLSITGGILVLAFLLAFLTNRYSISHPKNQQPVVVKEKMEDLDQRVSSIFSTTTQNRVKRLDIWSRTLEMVGDHPVLGVGAGNWKIMIPDYYQPDPNESFYHNWRRPHNDFLWILAEKGIVGLTLYAGFFISLFVIALRTLKKEIPVERKVLVVLMAGGLAGFLVDSMFSFPYDRVETLLYMMTFAGIIWVVPKDSKPEKPVASSVNHRVIPMVAAIFMIISFIISLQMIRSEKYIKFAHQAFLTGQWDVVQEAVRLAECSYCNLDPVNNPYRWYRGHALLASGKTDEAKVELERALEHNPNSVATLSDLGVVLVMKKEYAKALEYLDMAIKIYPLNREVLKVKGMALYELGRYKESVDCYYKCITDKPNPELDSLIARVHEKLYGTGAVQN